MAAPVYAIASNAVSSLGMSTAAHWKAIVSGQSGISKYTDKTFSETPFHASKLEPSQWQSIQSQQQSQEFLSPFEQLAIYSAKAALQECREDIDLSKTVVILSTTKGNIELLGQIPDERTLLNNSADIIAKHLGIVTKPSVVSHACVSGVVAQLYALRLLQAGRYINAIVIGCDRFSKFVLSGFQSFLAISDEPCRPFDEARKGITLGEAAATVILSTRADEPLAQLCAAATSNDANHISGPSRTGEELALAISRTLAQAGVVADDINMISAHGTATGYNDEMESKAFALSGLLACPVHSFKGYVGHTLGAAGVLETVVLIESLRHQQLIPSLGFEKLGVSQPLNITTQLQSANIKYALKTASGFGGCNAAMIWKRS
ncbi:MAG: beta-ketoacyl synthase [Bacteroidetes bacterium]|nr:beta-ketoacyl synthase [Bacteroidota bacterium]